MSIDCPIFQCNAHDTRPVSVRFRGRRGAFAAVILGIVATVFCAAARAAPHAGADDQLLWVVQPGVSLPQGGLGSKLIFSPIGKWFERKIAFPVRRGEILRVAVLSGELHAFFADGSYWRFSQFKANLELKLPGSTLPVAIAADPAHNALLALVPARILRRIAEENERRDRIFADDVDSEATQSSTSAPSDAADDVDAADWVLVRYVRRRWESVGPLPEFVDLRGAAWIAASGDELALVWRPSTGSVMSDLRFSRRVDGTWTEPESLPQTDDLTRCSLGYLDRSPILLGVRPETDDRERARLVVFQRREGDWAMSELQAFSGGPLVVPSSRSTAALCQDQVFVFQIDDAGKGTFAFFSPEGDAQQEEFTPVTELNLESPGWTGGQGIEIAGYIALVLLVTLVFVRRQESLLIPAVLPPGLVPASVARRGLALLLDGLPAVVITMPLWVQPLNEVLVAYPQQAADPAVGRAFRTSLWLPFLYPRLVYTLYCMIWELTRGITPGKMVVRIGVCTLAAAPCSRRQIAVRNLFRLVETEPLLMIWPLLMLLAITRNRQRLGDIWARTIVVQSGPVPPSTQRSDSDEGSER